MATGLLCAKRPSQGWAGSGIRPLSQRARSTRQSRLGLIPQGLFINCVVELSTALEPLELLAQLKEIEVDLGRVKAKRWGPRLIDLDILFYGDPRS